MHRTRRRRTEALWRIRKLHNRRRNKAGMAKEIIKNLMTEMSTIKGEEHQMKPADK